MSYQHSNTNSAKGLRYILPIIPVLVAVLLVVARVDMPATLAEPAHAFARPFWQMREGVTAMVVATYDSMSSTESLVSENISLHNEVSSLRRENFNARIIAHENERLRTLVGRSSDDNPKQISAIVLNNDALSAYDAFILDAGKQSGVLLDALVISPEGIAVGRVTRLFEKTSVVTRFSSPSLSTEVLIQGTTTVHAKMVGYGGGTMLLTLPRDMEVSLGDMVSLPNLEATPLGQVAEVLSAPEDAYKHVYARTPTNLFELRYVFVDTDSIWKPEQAVEQGAELVSPEGTL
jgi:rod shape-determining protein MreC